MPAPSEISWDMYEPRTTLKAIAAEDMTRGESAYISTDGLAYVTDNTKSDQFNGCVLKDTLAGEEVVLVTHGRLNVTALQTIGGKAVVSNASGGGPPGTAAGGTAAAGFAISAYLLFIHAGTGAGT